MVERMTEEQAAALLEHIDELGAKLTLADDQAKKNRNLTRWLLGATGVLVALCVLMGSALLQIQSSQITNCENANKTRGGQRQIWTERYKVEVAAAEAQDLPQSVLDYYDDLLAWETGDKVGDSPNYPGVLADRDCDHLDAEAPDPGDAPSFEQALKDALADQAND